jgi:hypothetical protein
MGLAVLLLIRWLDPWPTSQANRGSDVVQAIVRAKSAEAAEGASQLQAASTPESAGFDRLASSSPVRDLFVTRAEINAQAQQAQQQATQSAAQLTQQKARRKQAAQPPPPPLDPVVPPEAPPPLQVVGTWAGDDRPAVFMSTPNGTMMARESEILLGQYKVQRIEPRQISLQDTQTQKVWQLPIPDAPTASTTWPTRHSP